MQVAIPFDIYLLLEEKLGKAEALKVGKAIEVSLSAINEHAEQIVLQKKLELREELSKELVSKADLLVAKTALEAKIDKAEFKLNTKLNFLIALMIIALTLMNPVVADIIKNWLK